MGVHCASQLLLSRQASHRIAPSQLTLSRPCPAGARSPCRRPPPTLKPGWTSCPQSTGCTRGVQRLATWSTYSHKQRTVCSATELQSEPAHILIAALNHDSRNIAVVDPSGANHTYSSIFQAASAVADILQPTCLTNGASAPATHDNGAPTVYHLGEGSRVGLFSKPGAEFVASLWGTWLAGHVAVPLCTSHPAAELVYVLQNSEASLVLGPEESRDLLAPIAEQLGIPFVPYSPVSEAQGDARIAERVQAQQLQGSTKGALFIYTSGTTGRPKGVVHSHASLAAQADMLVEAWEYRNKDRFLHVLPLHHVHGVMNALLAPLAAGATVDFMPKFNPVAMWARLRKAYPKGSPPAPDAVTVFTGVPTHYVRLIQSFDSMAPQDQEASAYAASQLRLMMSGSAACPEPVMSRWRDITGQMLLERYGMTEFAMGLSNPLHGERKLGFVGYPLKGVQTKVESLGDAEAEGGELLVRSPGMFREYWKRPEANAEAFDGEGYFKTGDTVSVDKDGCFKILGRTSVDIIKSGGYKLSALEIESILLEHPRIAECAVLGVQDPDYGEAVAAVITAPLGEAALESRDLKKWCMEKMAHYKIPTKLRVLDEMPRNAMGKINKKELRRNLFDKAQQSA